MVQWRRFLLLVVAAGLLAFSLSAQQLYGFGEGNKIVSIDPTTGASTAIVATGSGGAQASSAADLGGRRIFFLGNMDGVLTLMTFSAGSGSVTQVPLPSGTPFLEYDPVTRLLYGFGTTTLISIDPSTGAVTQLAAVALDGIFGGVSTFDPVGRRVIFAGLLGGTPTLFTYSIGSNAVSHVSFPEASSIEYDAANGSVLALYGSSLSRIDPATGASTPIATVAVAGSTQGVSSFDPIHRKGYFVGDSGGQARLVTYDPVGNTVTTVNLAGAVFIESLPSAAQVPVASYSTLVLLIAALTLIALRRLSA
jgi:hypothetical protein